MQKIMAAVAFSHASAQLSSPYIIGSGVCLVNYSGISLDWYFLDGTFGPCTPTATTGAGQTTCEDLTTWSYGAYQDFDYVAVVYPSSDVGNQYGFTNPTPGIQYSSGGPTITYWCGYEYDGGLCCCVPGDTYYRCPWIKGDSYPTCVEPGTAGIREESPMQ